jgi:hypothetical protein
MDTNWGDSYGCRSCSGGTGPDVPTWQGGGATSPEPQPPIARASVGGSEAKMAFASGGQVGRLAWAMPHKRRRRGQQAVG